MRYIIIALATLALSGCASPKQVIGDAATGIREQVTYARANLAGAVTRYEAGEDPRGELTSVDRSLVIIDDTAAQVTRVLPGVEDKEGWFTRFFRSAFLIGLGVVGVWLIFYLGLGGLLVRALLWLVRRVPATLAMIPAAIRSEAKLDAEAIERTPDNQPLRESVAIKRQRPLYDVAYRAQREKKK